MGKTKGGKIKVQKRKIATDWKKEERRYQVMRESVVMWGSCKAESDEGDERCDFYKSRGEVGWHYILYKQVMKPQESFQGSFTIQQALQIKSTESVTISILSYIQLDNPLP